MRILLTTYQEKTFFYHLVPLAWALRTAGHEVRVATLPGFVDVVTNAGLTAVPVGHASDFWRITASQPDRLAAVRKGIMAPYDAFDDPDRATWEYLKPGMTEAVWGWHRTANFPMIAGLVDFARHWQPDLVIWEPLAFAGAIAAKACGAAHARLLWSIDIFGGVRERYLALNRAQPAEQQTDPFADWFSGYGRKYGFEFTEDMVTGNFTIDHLPPGLQIPAGSLDYLRMRYVPYGGPATVPKWLQAPPDRPRVAFTLGLSATEIFDGYNLPLSEVLDSLSDLNIELVATVPVAEQRKLAHVPDNARLVSYVPLHALAPTCAAAVHHGGLGTLATFAQHAVPQLTLPYHFDEPIFANRLTSQGAGLTIDSSVATGDSIRDAVQRLVTDAAFREGANRLRAETEALPTPNQVVTALEELTAKHRTR
ncbi:glycosyltransferase (activator-dependent family) [Kibdelosporangium banguiense]|uniref:Glycosyltransferase (Activator-dependent family) n=1 Tax=Kibdelosporangium banguiense TaxID=1365924 RepID=A0ABS4TXD5_9PSEU|nr:activator-dependent family glycosyltransferase [Kibdelosporangium banguiense]MBP2329073.1 glycosyltransferase (activator-dependent family) [Kibdelosporangium banguiense]